MARTVNVIIVTLPAIAITIVAAFGGEWSKDWWPWWVWFSFIVIAAFLVIVISLTRRAYVLEKDLEPKLKIRQMVHVKPAGAEKGLRTVRIEVENFSKTTLKECRVRETSFINRFGQSSGMHRHFRLGEETYADMAVHTYKRTFNLQGKGAREIIDIACLDETKDDSPVVMLYATAPTALTLNAIARDCFPHRLTISVTSDNLPVSEDRTYDLKITENGILEMVPIEK